MAYVSKNPKFDSTILKDNTTASVDNPPSGAHKIVNRGGTLYVKDSSGNETAAGGGTGELNLINDTVTASNWAASGAGITVATSTTASELPLSPVVDSGIKITPVSGTDYVRYRFTCPESLLNTKLKVAWFQEVLSGYADGDLKLEVYSNSQSDYLGTYTELSLSTDVSGTSSLPAATGQYVSSFDTTAALYYELRIVRVAGTTAVVLQNVIVGPGSVKQGAVVGAPTTIVPTFTAFGTVASTDFKYIRVGTWMKLVGKVVAGTATGSTAAMSLPGFTVDTTALPAKGMLGTFADLRSASTTLYPNAMGVIFYNNDSGFISFSKNTASDAYVADAGTSVTATGRSMQIECWIPIAEWAGSGTVNLANNGVEYASNNGTWDAAATASTTVYGPAGVLMGGALSLTRAKVVRFMTPIQATDVVSLEIQKNGEWLPAELINPYASQNSVEYGVSLSGVSGNDTDVSVNFSRYRWGGTTFGGAGTAWPSDESWRLKKTSGGQSVGFSTVSANASGLMPANLSNLDNATATRLGMKSYAHGTTYNGGNAPTITLSSGGGTLTTVHASNFIPYQLQDLSWRMKFNFTVTLSSTARTLAAIAVNGITSKNTSTYTQTFVSGNVTGAVVSLSDIAPNTNIFNCNHASGTTGRYVFQGDIELDSKPTWAY